MHFPMHYTLKLTTTEDKPNRQNFNPHYSSLYSKLHFSQQIIFQTLSHWKFSNNFLVHINVLQNNCRCYWPWAIRLQNARMRLLANFTKTFHIQQFTTCRLHLPPRIYSSRKIGTWTQRMHFQRTFSTNFPRYILIHFEFTLEFFELVYNHTLETASAPTIYMYNIIVVRELTKQRKNIENG